ncbi:MAG: DUF3352 domain-containing protein [Xenococcaceae cyanobacterium MO_188.B29]|nr:DUF3352 domain-containing protein [Xenococcaceae cyanobacterium MO_188.B29]
MSSKKSGCGCWSFLGITTILVIGGWYIYQQGWLGKKLTPLEGAKVIPKEAIVTSFISVESKNWSQLSQLGLPETEKIIEENIENIKREFSNSTTVNYQQDVQPWLGGIMLAILPQQLSIKSEESVLIVVGIKNKIKALKFIAKLQKESEEDWQERKYKGITITKISNQNNETINSALLGNKLVLSNDKLTLEKAIDTYKGESSLASKPYAKEILSQQLTIQNPIAHLYFTDFNYLIEQIAQEEISATALKELQQLESVVMGVGIQKEGIHLQSITNFKTEGNNSDFPTTDSKILSKLPNRTIAAVNGKNINQIWSATVKQIEEDEDIRRTLDLGRLSFRHGTGLDLDEDIFSWMDGEFTVGLITTDRAIIPGMTIGLGSTIILETNNPNKAKETLTQIEKSLKSYVGINSRQKKIDNKQTITEWIVPQSGLSLSHGWIDKNYLVFTIGNSVFESINNSPDHSFARSDKFKSIAQKLPSHNFGYFYLDMNQTMSIINQFPTDSTDISPEAMTILNSLQGIGATATMPDESTSQLDVLVLFK